MSNSIYRDYLTEEEKFLKQLDRNLHDQLNRLKVEELSLLKLISSSGVTSHREEDNRNHDPQSYLENSQAQAATISNADQTTTQNNNDHEENTVTGNIENEEEQEDNTEKQDENIVENAGIDEEENSSDNHLSPNLQGNLPTNDLDVNRTPINLAIDPTSPLLDFGMHNPVTLTQETVEKDEWHEEVEEEEEDEEDEEMMDEEI